MKKTVLLIQPGSKDVMPRLPINLLPIAAQLLKNGLNPVILDLRIIDFEDFRIDWNDVICVGISTYTGPMILQALATAKKVRAIDAGLPIIWGGIHCSILPDQTIKHELVDAVVKGDGEETMVELARALQKNLPFDGIKGVIFKKNGKIITNQPRAWFDLDKEPILPYELLEMEKYHTQEFSINTTKGCPFGCTFCYNLVYNQRSWRRKSAEKVVQEIAYIVKKWHPEKIMFVEDNAFVDRKRMEKICRGIIRKRLKFKWIGSTRADYLRSYDDKFMKLLKKSGCWLLTFGAESGSERMLKVINKGGTVEDNFEGVKKLKKYGIIGRISFVYGMPTETREDTLKTIALIKRMKEVDPRLIVNGLVLATPYPGTPLYDAVKKMCPEMRLFDTLEEWGNWQQYHVGNQPWLDKRYLGEMECASTIVRFQCLRDMNADEYFRSKLMVFLIKLATSAFNVPAAIRWKYNFYKFGIEWKFWNWVVFRVMGGI